MNTIKHYLNTSTEFSIASERKSGGEWAPPLHTSKPWDITDLNRMLMSREYDTNLESINSLIKLQFVYENLLFKESMSRSELVKAVHMM